jgi:hypothetical protein
MSQNSKHKTSLGFVSLTFQTFSTKYELFHSAEPGVDCSSSKFALLVLRPSCPSLARSLALFRNFDSILHDCISHSLNHSLTHSSSSGSSNGTARHFPNTVSLAATPPPPSKPPNQPPPLFCNDRPMIKPFEIVNGSSEPGQ